MKKTIATLLAICLCLGLCACGKQQQENASQLEETPPLEKVSADVLFDAEANVAAVQMHIGKETTIIGKISKIDVNCCTIQVVNSLVKTVTVEMETQDLATMHVDEIHVITGVVSSADEYGYTLTSASLADQQTKEEYIATFVEDIVSKGNVAENFKKLRTDILLESITNNTGNYSIGTELEAKEYISGKWNAWYVLVSGDCGYTNTITINTDDNSLKLANRGSVNTGIYDISQFKASYEKENLSLYAQYTFTDYTRPVGCDRITYTSEGNVYRLSDECCIVKSSGRYLYFTDSYSVTPKQVSYDLWYILERA